ncbi:hypothetical protein [Halobaculum limi]|uniref:hypothetical protein n=1 Tax=Halobaculum limi TaxID=3031916 RepID=UPI0024075EF2|nr:hypothetical protein [Halobaculum sp. YSMS11]
MPDDGDTNDPASRIPDDERFTVQSRSDRRRRAVRQLLFVVAGSHTGAFLGSSLPTRFGLPGDFSGVLLVVILFALPFAVDAKWERIEAAADRVGL